MNTRVEPSRIWVKICGITNRDDAMAAIDAGTDALGFNLWKGSKRFIALDENRDWIAGLPGHVERIAVVVNPSLDEARSIAQSGAFDAIQFHGDEDTAFLDAFATSGFPMIVARRLQPGAETGTTNNPTDRLLIDAAVPGEFGGTGVMLDVELARRFVERNPDQRVILAGGLTPANVAEAIAQVRPYGVDVASGVERDPRKKDPLKIEEFVRGARKATD